MQLMASTVMCSICFKMQSFFLKQNQIAANSAAHSYFTMHLWEFEPLETLVFAASVGIVASDTKAVNLCEELS